MFIHSTQAVLIADVSAPFASVAVPVARAAVRCDELSLSCDALVPTWLTSCHCS